MLLNAYLERKAKIAPKFEDSYCLTAMLVSLLLHPPSTMEGLRVLHQVLRRKSDKEYFSNLDFEFLTWLFSNLPRYGTRNLIQEASSWRNNCLHKIWKWENILIQHVFLLSILRIYSFNFSQAKLGMKTKSIASQLHVVSGDIMECVDMITAAHTGELCKVWGQVWAHQLAPAGIFV